MIQQCLTSLHFLLSELDLSSQNKGVILGTLLWIAELICNHLHGGDIWTHVEIRSVILEIISHMVQYTVLTTWGGEASSYSVVLLRVYFAICKLLLLCLDALVYSILFVVVWTGRAAKDGQISLWLSALVCRHLSCTLELLFSLLMKITLAGTLTQHMSCSTEPQRVTQDCTFWTSAEFCWMMRHPKTSAAFSDYRFMWLCVCLHLSLSASVL